MSEERYPLTQEGIDECVADIERPLKQRIAELEAALDKISEISEPLHGEWAVRVSVIVAKTKK